MVKEKAIAPFKLARLPEIHFGPGSLAKLAALAAGFGRRALVVTGGGSLQASGWRDNIVRDLEKEKLELSFAASADEPTPELVDAAAAEHRPEGKRPDVVIAIGGGSVMDAGKAMAAMIPVQGGESVADFLEDLGKGAAHSGVKIPFIAVPTTAGTGSEATKNAVLGRHGSDGFKKSLRHDNFVPDIAIVDPELTLSCPSEVSAACGLDAFVQLMESYVSRNANPMTDALAAGAMDAAKNHVTAAAGHGADKIETRTAMAYASLVSGITLANAGLGLAHGFATEIGGMFPIPHGVICGTLITPVTQRTIERLRENAAAPENQAFLKKYAAMGAMLGSVDPYNIELACATLLRVLEAWTGKLHIKKLGHYGVTEADLRVIADKTSNKHNPVELGRKDLFAILKERL
ncbi:MAG: iron-containing alcohol dehydrogenase [Pseudomonadota bacterium]